MALFNSSWACSTLKPNRLVPSTFNNWSPGWTPPKQEMIAKKKKWGRFFLWEKGLEHFFKNARRNQKIDDTWVTNYFTNRPCYAFASPCAATEPCSKTSLTKIPPFRSSSSRPSSNICGEQNEPLTSQQYTRQNEKGEFHSVYYTLLYCDNYLLDRQKMGFFSLEYIILKLW